MPFWYGLVSWVSVFAAKRVILSRLHLPLQSNFTADMAAAARAAGYAGQIQVGSLSRYFPSLSCPAANGKCADSEFVSFAFKLVLLHPLSSLLQELSVFPP